MNSYSMNRGELVAFPFAISDSLNQLAGKRVTMSLGRAARSAPLIEKVSGLPGSSDDVTILTQTAGAITGSVTFRLADFLLMPRESYCFSLWVDSGIDDDRCMTAGGVDKLNITNNVQRTD